MISSSESPEWLETDWILDSFYGSRQVAIDKYINFVRSGIGLPPIWSKLKYQMYLGDDEFIGNIHGKIDDSKRQNLNEISRVQRRSLSKLLYWYKMTEKEQWLSPMHLAATQ